MGEQASAYPSNSLLVVDGVPAVICDYCDTICNVKEPKQCQTCGAEFSIKSEWSL